MGLEFEKSRPLMRGMKRVGASAWRTNPWSTQSFMWWKDDECAFTTTDIHFLERELHAKVHKLPLEC